MDVFFAFFASDGGTSK